MTTDLITLPPQELLAYRGPRRRAKAQRKLERYDRMLAFRKWRREKKTIVSILAAIGAVGSISVTTFC